MKNEALKMCWFMRGSLTYEDALLLSKQDREIIGKIIEDNIETTNKTGIPLV